MVWLKHLQIHGYELRIHTRIDEKDALTALLLDAPLLSSSFFLPSSLTMRFHRFSYVHGGFTNESVGIDAHNLGYTLLCKWISGRVRATGFDTDLFNSFVKVKSLQIYYSELFLCHLHHLADANKHSK